MILTRCDQCKGGVVHQGKPDSMGYAWGEPCATCQGQGHLTLARIAVLLDEWPATIRRVFAPRKRERIRPSTTFRICTKLIALQERKAAA